MTSRVLSVFFEKEQFDCTVSNTVSYEDLLTMALTKCNIVCWKSRRNINPTSFRVRLKDRVGHPKSMKTQGALLK